MYAQSCPILCNPSTAACQAPLSMGFLRLEYWSGLPVPPPGDLPNPGIEPRSPVPPALAGGFFTTELPGSFPVNQFFASDGPKYSSFSFSISSSNEYSGLISFRMDWLDLLAVQGTLKSLLQHHTQFKSINSLALSFLHSPALTSIHDHWKDHSLD